MSNENNEMVLKLQQDIALLQGQLSHATCEKMALDNAYGDQIRITHQVRTQLAFAQAERDALQAKLREYVAFNGSLEEKKSSLEKEIEVIKAKLDLVESEKKEGELIDAA